MADLRRQTGDVRTSTVDSRLYRSYDASRAATSLTQGLRNVGAILSGADQRAAQRERSRLTTLENEARDTIAQDQMLAATDRISDLVSRQTDPTFGPDVDLDALNEEDRIVRLLELAKGQRGNTVLGRVRALASLQSRITYGDPEKAYEYMQAYKDATGRTFFEEIAALEEETQGLDAPITADDINTLRNEYNLPVTATAREVLEFDQTRSRLQREYDAILLEKNVATTNQELVDLTTGKRLRAAANNLSIQMQTALNGVLVNPETGELLDFVTMDPQERQNLVFQMEQQYNTMLSTVAQNLSSEQAVVTNQDLIAANPLISTRLDFAKKVISGELTGAYAERIHKYYMDMERNQFLENPDARRMLFTVQMFSEIQDPQTVVELKNFLVENSFDPIKGIADLLSSGFVEEDPVPEPQVGTEGDQPAPSTRAERAERQRALQDTKAGLQFIGIQLSHEQFDPLSEQGKASVRALYNIGKHLSDSPGRVSQPYMRAFAEFVATEEGFQALQAAANANGYDADIFAQFKRGFDNYAQRTAASLANYVRDDLEPGGVFSILNMGELTNTVTYEIMPDGRIAFMPQAGYNRNEIPRATAENVERRVRELNRRYSDAITAQVRAYAHLNNSINNYRDGDTWDYQRAFVDLMTMGEQNINESPQTILEQIRSRYPDLADATEEEVTNALAASAR